MVRIGWRCPFCGGELIIKALECPSCNSRIEGSFETCRFCAANEEDLNFLIAFLKGRGNIKRVEKSLNISYPTARSRLDHLLKNLGLHEASK
ncbi:MAG: DUF2089 domain-containing protein [bacterium]